MPRCRTLFTFALKMIGKPLHFVQRGRILLRCGSAFALSLPSLGVSSLDLGRLFIQAALFSCRCSIPSSFRDAPLGAGPESILIIVVMDSPMCNCTSKLA